MTQSYKLKIPLTAEQAAVAPGIAQAIVDAHAEWAAHQTKTSKTSPANVAHTFKVSVPAWRITPDQFLRWIKPKMMVPGKVVSHMLNGDFAVVELYEGVRGVVHKSKVSRNPLVLLKDALPIGAEIIAQVHHKGQVDKIGLNTFAFTVPRARMAQVADKEVMKGRVLQFFKNTAGADVYAFVALPDGMMGILEARYFRNHMTFPLSRRLSVGQEIWVEANMSKRFHDDCLYVTPKPHQKAVYDRLHMLLGMDLIFTGVVSGRNNANGPYFVAFDGVLDGALFPNWLKTSTCGCSHCDTEHREELEVGQEVQVRIVGMGENEKGLFVHLSRKDLP